MRRIALALVVLLAGGCYESRAPIPCALQATERNISEVSSDAVDLLFVIDDSRSMEVFQDALRRELPRLVRGLLTGDHDGDPATPSYPRVTSLRVAIITTDMGELGFSTYPEDIAPFGCYGSGPTPERVHYGTDGVMVRTARGQDTPANPTGLDCDFDGDGLPDSVSAAELPTYFEFGAELGPPSDTELAGYVDRVSCFGLVGIGGCGSEMPFESMLKSLTPRSSPIRFHTAPGESNDLGHGDDPGTNAGWLRPDSLLAVVVLTDEDDCSSGDRRVFDWGATAPFDDPANPSPGDPDSSYAQNPFQRGTRCVRFADSLHPIDRYVDGLLALRPDPERVVFAAITGVASELVDDVEAGEGRTNLSAVLADPRMAYVLVPDEDGQALGAVRTACDACDPADGSCDGEPPIEATPARRVVALASALAARGANTLVQSICEPSYAGAIEHILSTVGTAIAPTCLPLELVRNGGGFVGCTVSQTLAQGDRCANHVDEGLAPTAVQVTAEGREVCVMTQLPVLDEAAPMGTGWYLDDFSADAARCGTEGRRLTFVGAAGLGDDARTSVECVTRRLEEGTRTDVGSVCDYGTFGSCALTEDESADFERRYGLDALDRSAGLPNLRCEPATSTCQLPCADAGDCPVGTICSDPAGGSDWFYFPRCVTPTCAE